MSANGRTPTSGMDGFGASTLCAVHCAALPIVASVLPAVGGGVLSTPLFEAGMIGLGAVLATLSLSTGYRRHHHRPWALLVAGVGFASITAGHAVAPESLEPLFTASGAFTVALGHVVNARLCRRCCTPPSRTELSRIPLAGADVSGAPES